MLVLGWAVPASAVLMPPVYVDGNAWLQPVDFVDYSWGDIANVCDPLTGVCDGWLGGNDMTGLRWASLLDISDLYTATIPTYWTGGIGSVSYFSNPQIQEFNNFFDVYGFVPGFDADIGIGRLRQLFAYTADGSEVETVFQATGYVAENIYLAANNGDFQNINSGHDVGAWFFSEVPAPATIPLFCAALAAMFLGRVRQERLPQ